MTRFADDIIAFARVFGLLERGAVCCGDVTASQCVAMQVLQHGPQDHASLAATLGVTRAAVTQLVNGLQAKGYVERSPDAEDRRRVFASLTARGAREASRLDELFERELQGILERIPKAKRARVVEAVALLRRAAEQSRDALLAEA